MRHARLFPLALLVALLLACRRDVPTDPRSDAHAAPIAVRAPIDAGSDPGPVRTVDVAVPGDRNAIVVRGARANRRVMLFVPGMCVHPGGYVMSFQHTAASRGTLISVQGDLPCGDDANARRWSSDLEAMDRRIDAAFAAAGLGAPREVIVIGYSQGADRAEKLVARWPDKYSAAILIGAPGIPSAARLTSVKAVALMAGTNDRAFGPMRDAVPSLKRAGIRAAFFPLPGASHGQMGETPEASMRDALDFVEAAAASTDAGATGGSPVPSPAR